MTNQKIYTDIEETASQVVARRSAKVEITEEVFTAIAGRKAWDRYKAECIGGNNSIDSPFYRSTVNGSTCVFVSAGNIDRIFHPRFEGMPFTADYMNEKAEAGVHTLADLQTWADFQNLSMISIDWRVEKAHPCTGKPYLASSVI